MRAHAASLLAEAIDAEGRAAEAALGAARCGSEDGGDRCSACPSCSEAARAADDAARGARAVLATAVRAAGSWPSEGGAPTARGEAAAAVSRAALAVAEVRLQVARAAASQLEEAARRNCGPGGGGSATIAVREIYHSRLTEATNLERLRDGLAAEVAAHEAALNGLRRLLRSLAAGEVIGIDRAAERRARSATGGAALSLDQAEALGFRSLILLAGDADRSQPCREGEEPT
jgi:hypothetical protein